MNITYMRYAIETANCGSMGKAADKLGVAQPNLSRAIKELENDLGIKIFERISSGVIVTPDGEEFLQRARRITDDLDSLDNNFRKGADRTQRFSLCAPSTSYVLSAVNDISVRTGSAPTEIFYDQCSINSDIIRNVAISRFGLGIVHCGAGQEPYYKGQFEEFQLKYECIREFELKVTVNKNSPLAALDILHKSDLEGYTEVVFTDRSRPVQEPTAQQNKIYVYERASRPIILSERTDAFMLLDPVVPDILETYGLVQRRCADITEAYKDFLIYRSDNKMSALDEMFIDGIMKSRDIK